MRRALSLQQALFDYDSTAYRLINEESDGLPGSQRALRLDVLPKDRLPSRAALYMDLAWDHHRIPHPVFQQAVHYRFVCVQLAA
jgi:hypothetical protein